MALSLGLFVSSGCGGRSRTIHEQVGGNGATKPEPEPENTSECVFQPFTRGPCAGGCVGFFGFAMRCPSPLSTLQMAESFLLVEHANGTDLFGWPKAELERIRTWALDPGTHRQLTAASVGPIVARTEADGVLILEEGPFSGALLGARIDVLLDASYDAGNVRVLTQGDRDLSLWSVDALGTVSRDRVSETSLVGEIPKGSRSPSAIYAEGSGIWSFQGGMASPVVSSLPVAIGTTLFSSVEASNGRLIFANLPTEDGEPYGTVLVNENGVERSFGNRRALRCPADYVATYPDVCEFESVPSVFTPGAALVAQVIERQGVPWLISIVGDTTDVCSTFSSGCFETLPCDCTYRRFGSTVQAQLRLENLDEPAVITMPLGDFPYETVYLAASADQTGSIFVTVGEHLYDSGGGHAGASIDYLWFSL